MAEFSIGGSFNKSVFNKGSYEAAIGDASHNGYAVVKITPKYARTMAKKKDPPIKGVYNNADGDLSFSIQSIWADMGGIAQSVLPAGQEVANAFQKIGAGASLMGVNSQAAVYASKKIYQKSDYMSLKIPMMVVDWEGNGQPVLSSLFLANYCLPSGNVGQEIAKRIDEYLESQSEKSRNPENALDQLGGAAANLATGSINIAEGVMNKAVQTLKGFGQSIGADKALDSTEVQYTKENVLDGLDDVITLRASPVPVEVEIGNFFKHSDMVIENLEYTFSKEMTKMGPLYVKFNISLTTRKVLATVEDVGLYLQSTSRYMELGGNLTGGF